MELHPSVADRLARLAPDQRAAAIAPPGPLLCVAPAGSGKTTTLVARIAWLIASGTATPAEIAAITFNTRAAEELRERLASALAPLDVEAGAVRVRTFHALGLEILRDSGAVVEPLVDRMAILRQVAPAARAGRLAGARHGDLAAEARPGRDRRRGRSRRGRRARPPGRSSSTSGRSRRRAGSTSTTSWPGRWRSSNRRRRSSGGGGRGARHLLVDEAQDLDRAQLRLALLLAAPANRVFFVGDDDQSIYGWRLADVRRVLSLADALPGLRRADLVVNYRCPPTVVGRAVRLVEHNRERFAKTIRAGPSARRVDRPRAATRATRRSGSGGSSTPGRTATTRRGRSSPGQTASCCRRSPSASTGASRFGHRPRSSSSARRSSTARSTRRRRPTGRCHCSPDWRRCAGRGQPLLREIETDVEPDPDAPQPADIARALLAWSVPFATLARPPSRGRGTTSRARRAVPRRRAADASPRPTGRRASSSTTWQSSAWTPAASRAAAP